MRNVNYKALVCFFGLASGGCAFADVSVQLTSLLERHALANGVDITQLGDLNVADVTQGGDANYAVLLQQGVLNQIYLQQYGSGNEAQISQFGNNNVADILQQGESNLIQLEQWGNRSFAIEQIGNGAEISIIQY
ncbi:minor curlin subunit [Arsukibacterium tuosuense]|uniref:Minor curlin subunit n=1 Tax=Arsukibacterium tuosuense TaxID=1323745 RepID=A0A285I2X0_9GAMM|nr:curlin subunit CsgB [Arsukibacterium tuosuense]SNY41301.1 minor curlin subunit [Arsukibacterium tuosuense]